MSETNNDNNGQVQQLGFRLQLQSQPRRPKPPDMILSEQEEDWTWDLINLVETQLHAELKLPSEMEYAQHAMVTRGNLPKAVEQLEGLQRFRETYGVRDTVEEGMTVLEQFLRLQPGVLLSVGHFDGQALLMWNCAKFDAAKAFESRENWKVHVMAYYYLMRLLQPTLEATRKGAVVFLEAKDMEWENFDQSVASQLREEIGAFCPVEVHQVYAYNTNSVANMAYNLCKPLLGIDLQRRVLLGRQIEVDTEDPTSPKISIGELYGSLRPNEEEAFEEVKAKLCDLLTLRHEKETDFEM